jgi:glutathione S-transferase
MRKPLILFGNTVWTSPYVLSCFVALREKELPFEVNTIPLHLGAQHDPAFAAHSLTSRVPVLLDSGLALSESSAIVEYLEEAYPSPEHACVLPTDRHSRARARQVMAWLRSDLMPIREERSAQYVFYPHDVLEPAAPLSPSGIRAAEKLLGAAERLVPVDSGPMFGAWCVADTDLAMMIQRLIKTDFDVPSRIRAYANAQWERPAVKEFTGQPRPPFRPMLVR